MCDKSIKGKMGKKTISVHRGEKNKLVNTALQATWRPSDKTSTFSTCKSSCWSRKRESSWTVTPRPSVPVVLIFKDSKTLRLLRKDTHTHTHTDAHTVLKLSFIYISASLSMTGRSDAELLSVLCWGMRSRHTQRERWMTTCTSAATKSPNQQFQVYEKVAHKSRTCQGLWICLFLFSG